MKILIFAAGGDIGGGKTHIINIAKELSKYNQLRLVCFRVGVMSREAKELGIDTVDIDVSEGFRAAERLALNQAAEFKPDIIHCHGSKANLLGIIVKKKLGCCVMSTVHSDPKLDYMGSFFRRISYGNINAWALRHMDYYVAVAPSMKDLLISRRFDPQRIGIVFNGLDFSNASAKPRTIKPDEDTITIGIAARLNPVKNVSSTIRAFEIAYKQDKRLRLSIAGTGDDEESLRKLVKELNLESVVRFEGWIEDIKAYLSTIDINVISSISETFPYSLLEGAYVHCPAIASNVGGIPFLIEYEKTGLLFESGDNERFANEMLALARDPELRNRLGEALFKKALTDFSVERMGSDQQAIYEKAIRSVSQKGRCGTVICGAYGKGNAGDDAILYAITKSLKSIDDDMRIYVLSRKPKETRLRYHVNSIFTFDIFKLNRILKKSKLFISGGGTLVQDVTSTRSIRYYLYTLRLAKRCGCKIEMYGCGIGPVNKESNRKKTREVLNKTADVITLRDSNSVELLKELNITNPQIMLSSDPTVNLPELSVMQRESAYRKYSLDENEKRIVFCIRPWPSFTDYEAVAKAADRVYENFGLKSLFIPMEYPTDVSIGKEIADSMKTAARSISDPCSIDELRAILSGAELVVGMRLHSLVFAAASGTPIVGISYDIKVTSFLQDSGVEHLIDLSELDEDCLYRHISESLAEGRTMGEETKKRLQKLERLNSEFAAKLLGE